jgi:hypothetical protein
MTSGQPHPEHVTWASHPNAALRVRIADFVGRGYAVEMVDANSAVVSKPKVWTRPTRVLVMPFYLINVARRDRVERFLLDVGAGGDVRVSRL